MRDRALSAEPGHARIALGAIATGNAADIACKDLRGVGAAPVQHEADACRFAPRDLPVEIGLDHQRGDHLLPVDRVLHRLFGVETDHAPELGAGLDALDQFPRMDAIGMVDEANIDILDVQRRGEGEHQELDERRQHQHDARLGIAQQRPHLLDDHGFKAREIGHHASRLRLVARKHSTKNPRPKHSMMPMFGRMIDQMSPAMNTVCNAGMR